MKIPFTAALIYLGFFGVIGFTIYITKSAYPLWALLLTPTMKQDNETP
jgi:hypothetical protein